MLKIELEPTKRIEVVNGLHYRIYTGRTNTGAQIEMLGLFRINDPLKREEFERAVCAVRMDEPAPVRLLSEHGLVRP